MPVTKSAKKKLRQDKKRELKNSRIENLVKKSIKKVRRELSKSTFENAVKTIDKATQKNIIAKNKAARIKSRLSKLFKNKKSSSTTNQSKIEKAKK